MFDKIKDIKGKAEQSEVMVQEICADIKQLDVAKRHLTTTITSLKRLQMLITAVDRLQDAASRRQYQDAAQLLEAVNQLFTHFDEYDEVPKVRFMNTCSRRGCQQSWCVLMRVPLLTDC